MEDIPGSSGLWDHPLYQSAKQNRDRYAAIDIIDQIAKDDVLNEIYDCHFNDSDGAEWPYIIAPAKTIGNRNNSLAISYAEWLGHEFGWPVEERVFQQKTMSRDRNGAWFRLAHRTTFYGAVHAGRNYVIVDDVMTMGGTLADLKGFIESQGGRVICMSVLAHRSGRNVHISLANSTLSALQCHHGPSLGEFCEKELGYDDDCLTEPEAIRLLNAASLDRVREALDGARNPSNARGSSFRSRRASSPLSATPKPPYGRR